MIEISIGASGILQTYIDDYADYKTPQEYGRSAFWNWFYQICDNMYSLDREDLEDGYNQTYSMNYWGNIIYNKISLPNNQYMIEIKGFKFDIANFQNWLNHRRIIDRTTRTQPNTQTPINPNWHISGTCTNGFQIVWCEDEYNHTIYNYSYKGKIVYTKNDGTPMTFTKVTDFKNNTAYASYYKWKYILKTDGVCIRLGNSNMMQHKERNVPRAEYNHYKRYLQGDSKQIQGNVINEKIIDRIITEVLYRYLGKELLRS